VNEAEKPPSNGETETGVKEKIAGTATRERSAKGAQTKKGGRSLCSKVKKKKIHMGADRSLQKTKRSLKSGEFFKRDTGYSVKGRNSKEEKKMPMNNSCIMP